MPAPLPPLPTTVVGSLPQPDWLIDRDRLGHQFPPRVRAKELWRVPPEFLQEAQDDATLATIRAQEQAGLDIVGDGEIRRESYSNHFATALEGLDLDHPGSVRNRSGIDIPAPRVVGEIRRSGPVQVDDVRFLRAQTDRAVKITVPGPFTMAQQAQDDHYGDDRALALAYAEVVRAEIADLFAAGADIVQLDEPWLQARPEVARRYGVEVLTAALADAPGPVHVHVCFGYAAMVADRPEGYSVLPQLADVPAAAISIETAQSHLDPATLRPLRGKGVALGVLDLSTPEVETPETVADRVRRALDHVDVDTLVLSSDCGLKYLPRESAAGKMRSLARAAELLRAEL
ncbi:5-methyltetrahydropteroyltriglutamate--homocysteine methyltransferase [Modestobacter sp. VKM Ac-2979]|uniref:5-methyltetrahydropteroyltriglutamate-- homocysteine methyltransferase n=1 Tax=unclassified Modestobacter TaxID=2643866 RepID=UPI0022AB8BE1|nr:MULTISPECIES: 5-methyltetrahydropteroyltriglutamate--homocysteine methyltransferase [unclassified Modestobacter]MCZ2810176.1 5-methyltetrahydropteroyltriglutamate--homocysteine methyltransferase [Modestobacter sp. VKM Ac-2979]MCZ2841662.1 5-methyltetrahydropteroyltriglutamate--homocysteine methyltransferase [Modestobacter sp. VKM Ac-2980]